MEETITVKELKAFFKSHVAIKKSIFAAECKISRFTLERILKGETPMEKADKIEKVAKKYGFKFD